MNDKKVKEKRIVTRISEEEHLALKIKLAKDNKSIQDLLYSHIKKYLKGGFDNE